MSMMHAPHPTRGGSAPGLVGLLALCLLPLAPSQAASSAPVTSPKAAEALLNKLWHLPPLASHAA